jgi:hypothetical protein
MRLIRLAVAATLAIAVAGCSSAEDRSTGAEASSLDKRQDDKDKKDDKKDDTKDGTKDDTERWVDTSLLLRQEEGREGRRQEGQEGLREAEFLGR